MHFPYVEPFNVTLTPWHHNNHVVFPQEELEEQMKADKIKLALEKLKEAKVKKVSDRVVLIIFRLHFISIVHFRHSTNFK